MITFFQMLLEAILDERFPLNENISISVSP